MGNKRFRLIASNPISEPSKDTSPSIEELQQLYDQRSHIPVKFRDMSWSSWFHINSRMIHQLMMGRIFLGGDSAHIHSPAGAQGMNTGIQDMIDLGWKVAMVLKGQAKKDLLESYTADRVPVIEGVLTKTEGLTQAIGAENALFRSLFNHIAPWIVSTDFVQQSSTARMSQLGLNYRDSPLSAKDGGPGSLEAGDRMPSLAVKVIHENGAGTEDRRTTTFDLQDPSAFTLFYSNLSDSKRTRAEIQGAMRGWHYLMRGYEVAAEDEERAAFEKLFGKSSSILMVRPDGYVAFAGTEHSIPKLAKYCDKWLIAEPLPVNKNE